MKVPKEYILLFIVGLFLLAYILDLVVPALDLTLASPYQFFQPELMSSVPFSTASVFIKAVGLFITPLWLLSFFEGKGFAKPTMLLVWAGLTQLYAIQDLATEAKIIPMEWSLSMALSGLVLLVPTIVFFVKAMVFSTHNNLTNAKMQETMRITQEKARKEDKNKS